jgi:hypothetical protein
MQVENWKQPDCKHGRLLLLYGVLLAPCSIVVLSYCRWCAPSHGVVVLPLVMLVLGALLWRHCCGIAAAFMLYAWLHGCAVVYSIAMLFLLWRRGLVHRLVHMPPQSPSRTVHAC